MLDWLKGHLATCYQQIELKQFLEDVKGSQLNLLIFSIMLSTLVSPPSALKNYFVTTHYIIALGLYN